MAELRTSDGLRLFVAESGPADAPLTVLLLHGWTEDHTVWHRMLPGLGDRLRVVAPDQRGHGDSDPAPRDSATIDRLADDAAELIAELVPGGPIVLVGHSMGGMAMMALADRHPEVLPRIAGAMFMSTSSGGLRDVTFGLPRWVLKLAAGRRRTTRSKPANPQTRPTARRAVRGALPVRNRALATVLIRWLAFGRRPDWADVRALVGQVDRADRHNAGEYRRELMHHDRRAALAAFVGVPTMVLVGDRDRMTPPDHARLIAAELPAAELVGYPGSGHALPYERHADVAARILRLAGVARHNSGHDNGERRTRGGRVRRSTAPA